MTKRKSTQDLIKHPVYFVAVLACTLRFAMLLLVWNHPERCTSTDTESYTSIAVNLLAGNGYSSCLQAPYWPDICRSPVYPFFLSAIMAIWGQNQIAVAIIQILLDVLSGVLIFHSVRALYGVRAACWAGLFHAIAVSSAAFSLKVLPETLCVFLIAGSLFCLTDASFFQRRQTQHAGFPQHKKRGLSRYIPGALFWALAVLCKPVVIVTALCFGWWLWKRKKIRYPLR